MKAPDLKTLTGVREYFYRAKRVDVKKALDRLSGIQNGDDPWLITMDGKAKDYFIPWEAMLEIAATTEFVPPKYRAGWIA
ncbi:MAG: hypothetical protein KGL04_02810, partial [Elusimicrobia bacterium]|nr:hypothetical protein [Elusimicrobiota bacterium]